MADKLTNRCVKLGQYLRSIVYWKTNYFFNFSD